MNHQTTSVTHAELKAEQDMLLQALASLGIDRNLAFDVAREPLWMPQGVPPARTAAHVTVPAGC